MVAAKPNPVFDQLQMLTPLKRDSRLGRVILNGSGGYRRPNLWCACDQLGVMLAGADLSGTDLRWTSAMPISSAPILAAVT